MALFFCPNQGCLASGKDNISIQQPLVELPVDPNHAFLACPYCAQRVTQCDGCYALIPDIDSQSTGESVCFCRKCGFPNLLDAEARLALALPRNHPLPFSAVRVLQRAVGKDSYKQYKIQEIVNLEYYLKKGTETTKSHTIVRLRNLSSTTTDTLETTPKGDENNIDINYKKRPRHDSLDQPSEPQEDDENTRSKKRPMRAPLTTNGINHAVNMAKDETSNALPGFNDGNLALEVWKSHLKVPIDRMLAVLRSQLASWDSKLSSEHDIQLLRQMHFQKRAQTFKQVHATFLKSLLDVQNPSNRMTLNGDLSIEPLESTSTEMCDRLNLFMADKDALLELRLNVCASEEISIPDSSNGLTTTQTLGNIMSKAGIADYLAKSILGLIMAKESRLSSFAKSKSSPHLPLLKVTSLELQRAFRCLKFLLEEERAAMTHRIAEGAPEISEKPSSVCPTTSSTGSHSNSFEHTKFYILLLSNLYKTVAAVVL
jgi:hypothetical protein